MNHPLTDAINVYRQKNGRKPLKEKRSLIVAAQSHSDDMAKHKHMGHYGSDWSSPFSRIKTAGYKWQSAGECVGWNYKDAQAMADGWMADLPHRVIVLGSSYTHIGIGEKSLYWTADFASGEPDDQLPPTPLGPDDFNLW